MDRGWDSPEAELLEAGSLFHSLPPGKQAISLTHSRFQAHFLFEAVGMAKLHGAMLLPSWWSLNAISILEGNAGM